MKTQYPTYILNSESRMDYYDEVAKLTNKIQQNIPSEINNILYNYNLFVNSQKIESPRNKDEYLIEILTLYILWKQYAYSAKRVNYISFLLLNLLFQLRQKNFLNSKNTIDAVRGKAMSILLPNYNSNAVQMTSVTMQSLKKLIMWLSATGEYTSEAKRLTHWVRYFKTLKKDTFQAYFSGISEFSEWCFSECEKKLAIYTGNLNNFLNSHSSGEKWREDKFQRGKQKDEYYLNMIGAELMNRAYKKDFDAAKKKIILAPGCMRPHNGKLCKAKKTQGYLMCSGCNINCNIFHLNNRFTNATTEVRIMLHESSTFNKKVLDNSSATEAIVGIACVPCLISGGWKARDMNKPAQCVLLNYSGCKKHWDSQGIMTSINTGQLINILKSEHEHHMVLASS
ncbi:MAG: DUF116 domain-containing protein [Bacteroidales bacterium]|nr:DUF116 domain-containing protein [Bacteroidales bacterium]